MTSSDKSVSVELSEAQKNFLAFCAEFGWGKLEVTIVNGEPVTSRELEHTHKHDIKK